MKKLGKKLKVHGETVKVLHDLTGVDGGSDPVPPPPTTRHGGPVP